MAFTNSCPFYIHCFPYLISRPPVPSTVLDSVNMNWSPHTEYNENSC